MKYVIGNKPSANESSAIPADEPSSAFVGETSDSGEVPTVITGVLLGLLPSYEAVRVYNQLLGGVPLNSFHLSTLTAFGHSLAKR